MDFLQLDETVNLSGHRVSVNDLKQLNNASDNLQQIIAAIAGNSSDSDGRVLSGFDETIDNGQVSYSGGWLFAEGQIWEIQPMAATAVANDPQTYLLLEMEDVYPPVVYQSGSSYQVHRKRIATVQYLAAPNVPTGTQGIDYVVPKREYRPAWVTYTGSSVFNFLTSPAPTIGASSTLSYKIEGKTLHLNVSIELLTPSPYSFEMNLSTEIVLKDKVHPNILGSDTHLVSVCRVSFLPPTVTDPSRVTIQRSHANTDTNTISFIATLELA